jgi:hypothetical protein
MRRAAASSGATSNAYAVLLQLRLLPADVVRDVRRVARRPWLRNRPTASSASVRLVTTATVDRRTLHDRSQ